MANVVEQGDTIYVDNRCVVVSPFFRVDPKEPNNEPLLVRSKNYIRNLANYSKQDSLNVIMTSATVVAFQSDKRNKEPKYFNLKELNKPVLFIKSSNEFFTYETWFLPILKEDISAQASVTMQDMELEPKIEKVQEEIPLEKLDRMREAAKAAQEEEANKGREVRQPQVRESLEKK